MTLGQRPQPEITALTLTPHPTRCSVPLCLRLLLSPSVSVTFSTPGSRHEALRHTRLCERKINYQRDKNSPITWPNGNCPEFAMICLTIQNRYWQRSGTVNVRVAGISMIIIAMLISEPHCWQGENVNQLDSLVSGRGSYFSDDSVICNEQSTVQTGNGTAGWKRVPCLTDMSGTRG